MLKPKSKTEPEVESIEFEAARARWAEINDQHREMVQRLDAMGIAKSWAGAPNADNMPQRLREKAHPFLKVAGKRPAKFAEQIADLQDEIAAFQPAYIAASEEWAGAMQAETDRIAVELQPRHRAAVQAVAKALESLSQAVADEIECHAELRRLAPLAASANMPDMAAHFLDICLSERGSRAWYWAKRARDLKIIGN